MTNLSTHDLCSWDKILESWNQPNVRLRRDKAVMADVHFGMTKRGKRVDTKEELRNMSLADLAQSPFWKRLVPDNKEDDEAVEAFWNTYFGASDIPDEWSLADQEKSHGRGSHRGADTSLIYWWNEWIPNQYLFGSDDTLQEVLVWMKKETLGTSASMIDKLIEVYKSYKSS